MWQKKICNSRTCPEPPIPDRLRRRNNMLKRICRELRRLAARAEAFGTMLLNCLRTLPESAWRQAQDRRRMKTSFHPGIYLFRFAKSEQVKFPSKIWTAPVPHSHPGFPDCPRGAKKRARQQPVFTGGAFRRQSLPGDFTFPAEPYSTEPQPNLSPRYDGDSTKKRCSTPMKRRFS